MEGIATALLEFLPNWAKVVAVIGFPGLFSLFSLFVWVGLIKSPVTATAAMVEKHVAHDAEDSKLLQLICEHTAKTGPERDTCVAARGGDTTP